MKVLILSLVFLVLTTGLFAVKVTDLKGLMEPVYIYVVGDDLFYGERTSKSVHVYSLQTLEKKFNVGSKGEGPGEFKGMPFIKAITPDRFCAGARDKYIWYSRKTGEIIEEKTLTQKFDVRPLKDNYITLSITPDKNQPAVQYKTIHLLNPKLERVKDMYTHNAGAIRLFPGDSPDRKINLTKYLFRYFCHDGKLIVADARKGFYIEVFDHNGNRLYAIDKNDEIKKIKMTDKFKKDAMVELAARWRRIHDRYKKSSFIFDEYFPAMKAFWVDGQKLYVPTYNEKDNKHEMIVLDIKGNVLARHWLPFKSMKSARLIFATFKIFTVHKDILYELIDNDETNTWELHKTDLTTVK